MSCENVCTPELIKWNFRNSCLYRDIELLQQNSFQYFINQRTGSIVTSRITANRHNDNFNSKLHPQLLRNANGMNEEIYSAA